MAGIKDKIVKRNIFDCLFYTTNYANEEDAFNAKHELVRYEFFEILVRIANLIYIKTNKIEENNHSRALHLLLNDYFINILTHNKLP